VIGLVLRCQVVEGESCPSSIQTAATTVEKVALLHPNQGEEGGRVVSVGLDSK